MQPFSDHSTMKNVAQQAGEKPSDHPATACPAMADFINNAEMMMSSTARRDLHELIPLLVGSRNPDATYQRRRQLAERAVRKWTAESFRTLGKTGIAQVIEQEPDLRRAASLADETARSLNQHNGPKTRATFHTATSAARAVTLLDDPDWTTQKASPAHAASALHTWSNATGKYMAAEAIEAVREALGKVPEPARR